jgi:predicted short-subunit dehydrogenase-like oxidoreductase (DUF2520 family)
MPSAPKPNVAIVGSGIVGSALAAMLSESGYRISSITSLDGKAAIATAKAVRCQKVSASVVDMAPETDIVIIAVPDRTIAQVTKQLACLQHLHFKKLLVLHTSGVHSADVLRPLKTKGALTASIHPVQTFPAHSTLAQRKKSLRGIYYGIDGEPKAIARAEQIVHDLDGKAVIIPAPLRPLYHLACVFASGYLMVLMNAISELAAPLGMKAAWTEVFGPLMTASMHNTIRHGAKNALTGPILRKDIATVNAHLEALASSAPQFLPLYMGAGIETARQGRLSGRLSEDDYAETIDLFRSFIRSLPHTTSTRGKR